MMNARAYIDFKYDPSSLERVARSVSRKLEDETNYFVQRNGKLFHTFKSTALINPKLTINYKAVYNTFRQVTTTDFEFEEFPISEQLSLGDGDGKLITLRNNDSENSDIYAMVLPPKASNCLPATIQRIVEGKKKKSPMIIPGDKLYRIVMASLRDYKP